MRLLPTKLAPGWVGWIKSFQGVVSTQQWNVVLSPCCTMLELHLTSDTGKPSCTISTRTSGEKLSRMLNGEWWMVTLSTSFHSTRLHFYPPASTVFFLSVFGCVGVLTKTKVTWKLHEIAAALLLLPAKSSAWRFFLHNNTLFPFRWQGSTLISSS